MPLVIKKKGEFSVRTVSVSFPDDPNVTGRVYRYLCEIPNVKENDRVFCPLGTHDRLQWGVVLSACDANGEDPILLKKVLQRERV